MKCEFFPEKRVHFGRMLKEDLLKICSVASYIFSLSFGQFVDTMPAKIHPLRHKLFTEPFYHIFLGTKALLHPNKY